MIEFPKSWSVVLGDELEKPYFLSLMTFVDKEYKSHKIYPPQNEVFNAFEKCNFENLKVVLIGQDPYHGQGQANGLCFSVSEGVAIPPSLRNIFKELHADCGVVPTKSGDLSYWAEQGVLMLNASLTVRDGQPGSHQNKGWEFFTDKIIELVSLRKENVVFILWGAYAHKKGDMVNISKHLVLKAAHPSPFAAHRGFFGCRHFSKTNEYLLAHGYQPIKW